MKKTRFSVEHITAVLQQPATGVPVGDVCALDPIRWTV